jgi:ABC-type lipoprotein release transport system permease subunit
VICIGIGLFAAWGLTRFLADLLYGVTPMDVTMVTVSACILITVALIASYFPARRAAMADPSQVLRSE